MAACSAGHRQSLPKMAGVISLMNAFSGGIFLPPASFTSPPRCEVGEENEYGGSTPSLTRSSCSAMLVFFVNACSSALAEMDHEGHGARGHGHGYGHGHGSHGHGHGRLMDGHHRTTRKRRRLTSPSRSPRRAG